MDANKQNFWMLAEERHFDLSVPLQPLAWDQEKRCLRLPGKRQKTSFSGLQQAAEEKLERIPFTKDAYNNIAWWDATEEAIVASGALEGVVTIYEPALLSESETELSNIPTDLAMGFNGVLYIAINGMVRMQDRRERWPDIEIKEEGFFPWRMATCPLGVWLLDRDNSKLGLLTGEPLPLRFRQSTREQRPQICEPNDTPPRLRVLDEKIWEDDETPVALAANRRNDLLLMCWSTSGAAVVYLVKHHARTETLVVTEKMLLQGITWPYSIAWHGEDKFAVLVAGEQREVPVFAIYSSNNEWWPLGDIYPLKANSLALPFVHTLSGEAHYLLLDDNKFVAKVLRKLSFPFFATQGYAFQNQIYPILDSTDQNTVWHRLFIEACIPKGCGVRVWLAATDEPVESSTIASWHEHRFGEKFRQQAVSAVPLGVWESMPSEIPHHPGFLPCTREKNTRGLFSVLIQRSNVKARDLKGRFLHVHIELSGTGRNTPEIYAVRAYGSRFNYVHEYLPEFYHETLLEPQASESGPASPADFFQRMVCNFEGVLTNMEDRIANAHLLTLPETVPESSLDWLAAWLGMQFDTALSIAQRRRILRLAPILNRWRGTLRGFRLALELATNGAVSSGKIVVVEDFRLRRTFSTIIGANLDDEGDPLTAGVLVSGNSYVGDTLFIGKESEKEFLALFSADLDISAAEKQAIDRLFDRLAHRVTILVHEHGDPQDLSMIERVAQKELPAHIVYRIVSASQPFLVGMASLVGIDSYLVQASPFSSARINQSYLSRHSFVSGPASLDPRLEGMGSGLPGAFQMPPFANAADVTAEFGNVITLNANLSRAWEGRSITTYRWSFYEE